jgi:hypothetical protein
MSASAPELLGFEPNLYLHRQIDAFLHTPMTERRALLAVVGMGA